MDKSPRIDEPSYSNQPEKKDQTSLNEIKLNPPMTVSSN